ncbi:MAG: SlyX family protein [Myxococcota bacterium]|nr:SlyX family protein [Myxococcota bacterium]
MSRQDTMAQDDGKLEQRVENLEVRIAFIEKSISDLDQVIQQLAGELDHTRHTLKQLREQVQSDSLTVRGDPMDEVPPHY